MCSKFLPEARLSRDQALKKAFLSDMHQRLSGRMAARYSPLDAGVRHAKVSRRLPEFGFATAAALCLQTPPGAAPPPPEGPLGRQRL